MMKPKQEALPIALIGLGKMGKNHLRVIGEDPRFQLRGQIDRNTDA
jgi:hypothetical protein